MCRTMSVLLRVSVVVIGCVPGLGGCDQARPYGGLPSGTAPSAAATPVSMASGVSAGVMSNDGAGAPPATAAGPVAGQGLGGVAGTSASSELGVNPSTQQAGSAAPEAAAPASPGACNIPECYSAVVDRCLPMGECTSAMIDSNFNLCFSNGVKFLTTAMFGATNFSASIRAIKPDGSLCYSSETAFSNGMLDATLQDATGNAFATTAANMATMTLSITCTGQPTVVVDREACFPGSSMMMMPMSGMMMCASGTCM
jgi:hypothetical protein